VCSTISYSGRPSTLAGSAVGASRSGTRRFAGDPACSIPSLGWMPLLRGPRLWHRTPHGGLHLRRPCSSLRRPLTLLDSARPLPNRRPSRVGCFPTALPRSDAMPLPRCITAGVRLNRLTLDGVPVCRAASKISSKDSTRSKNARLLLPNAALRPNPLEVRSSNM